MVVETRAPRNETPGCAVPPRTAHYVHGEEQGPCKFLIVQGIGVLRFRPGQGPIQTGQIERRSCGVSFQKRETMFDATGGCRSRPQRDSYRQQAERCIRL